MEIEEELEFERIPMEKFTSSKEKIYTKTKKKNKEEYKNDVEKNSLLFLGNGFDLRYKRETKFSDFMNTRFDLEFEVLNFIKDEFSNSITKIQTYDGGRGSKTLLEFILKNDKLEEKEKHIFQRIYNNVKSISAASGNLELKLEEIMTFEDYLSIFYNRNVDDLIENKNQEKYIFDWRNFNKKFLKSIKKNKKEIEKFSAENSWVLYFSYLKNNRNVKGIYKTYANWMDIENIIKLNFANNRNEIYCYDFLFKNEGKFEKFNEFKILLSQYLKTQNTYNEIQKEDLYEMKTYNTILNFNYTDINGLESKTKNIHGKIENKEDIVLGFDESELFVKEGVSLDTEAVRYTKVDQLIELYKDNNDLNNIFNKKYDRLGIYGLSMGEADYSYYTTIILKNIENIKITVYYIDGDESKDEFNNKYELREAFYHLIKHIEKVSGKQLYHNMVISGRIEFIPRTPLKNN